MKSGLGLPVKSYTVLADISTTFSIIERDLIRQQVPEACLLLFSYLRHIAWRQLLCHQESGVGLPGHIYLLFWAWHQWKEFVWIWSACIETGEQELFWIHSWRWDKIWHSNDIFQWLNKCDCTSSEGKLSWVSHHVSFIENNELHVAVATSKKIYDDRALVSANFLIYSRTTAIPLSSLAFNSITMLLKSLPNISRATATIVEVLPVPGGP